MADTVFTKSDDSTATVSTGTTLDSSDYPSGSTDGSDAYADFTLTITVANVNDTPTFTSSTTSSTTVGASYGFTVTTSDDDAGDTVTVAAEIPTASQSWLSFNSTTNVLSGTPKNDDIGQHIVELTATDSNSATATQTLTITVNGFQPQTRQQLIDAITGWIAGSITAGNSVPSGQGYGTYGAMNTWDVRGPNGSRITDMNSLFQNKTTFNEDISNWNVSNVTDISYMFDVAEAFNQNISGWNVSNVTTMKCMFCDATTFNQDLSGWERSTSGNTSTLGKVENMRSMFYGATNFNNGDSGNNEANTLNNWNVSSVTTMRSMFSNTAFNQDISGWNVSKVTNMFLIFYNTPFNQAIGQWNVSSVTTMGSMFENASAFNQDISGWERTGSTVGNVTNMSFMFYGSAFNQPIGDWNVSSVTTMKGMFSTNGSSVPFNQALSNWERTGSTVGNVTNMSFMFYGSAFNQPIGDWNVSSVTTMESMFSNADAFNQDLSGWDQTTPTTIVVTVVSQSDGNKYYVLNGDLSTNPVFNIGHTYIFDMSDSSNTDHPLVLHRDTSGTIFNNVTSYGTPGQNGATVTFVPLQPGQAFLYCTTHGYGMGDFYNLPVDSTLSTLVNVTSMTLMFSSAAAFNNGDSGDNGLKPLNNWNVYGCVSMSNMFQKSPFNQDIEEWNVSNVSSMDQMFADAIKFNKPLAKWERQSGVNDATSTSSTSKVEQMGYMFAGAEAFNQDIRTWTPLANVDLTFMFEGATAMIASYSTNPKFGNAGNAYTPLVTFFTNVTPVFTSSPTFSAAENQKSIGTVTATDGDNDTLTYFIDGNELEINMISGLLTFVNAPDYETKSTYTATVTVSDGTNNATQDITVNVTDENDRPVIISSATFNSDDKQTVIGQIIATDPEGGTLTGSISGPDADTSRSYYIQINPSTGELTFNRAPDFSNPSSVANTNTYIATVKVSDGINIATQTITVNVTNVNETPTFSSSTRIINVVENETTVGTVTATDPDSGTTLTYSITGGADAGSFNINSSSGALTFKTAPNYETKSSYTVIVTASDGTNSATQTITVNVTNVNESPTFSSSTRTINVVENETTVGTVTATDPEGGTITYSITGGADAGSFNIDSSSGALTFQNTPNFESPGSAATPPSNSYIVIVTASDGTNSAIQDITVNVRDVVETFKPATKAALQSAIDKWYELANTLPDTTSSSKDAFQSSDISTLYMSENNGLSLSSGSEQTIGGKSGVNVIILYSSLTGRANNYEGPEYYGNPNTWDVSLITDLSFLFYGKTQDNHPDISTWNVFNVTKMQGTFSNSTFNGQLNKWNVENVTDFSYCFANNVVFNQPLFRWNTQDATTLKYMFYNAWSFNQSITRTLQYNDTSKGRIEWKKTPNLTGDDWSVDKINTYFTNIYGSARNGTSIKDPTTFRGVFGMWALFFKVPLDKDDDQKVKYTSIINDATFIKLLGSLANSRLVLSNKNNEKLTQYNKLVSITNAMLQINKANDYIQGSKLDNDYKTKSKDLYTQMRLDIPFYLAWNWSKATTISHMKHNGLTFINGEDGTVNPTLSEEIAKNPVKTLMENNYSEKTTTNIEGLGQTLDTNLKETLKTVSNNNSALTGRTAAVETKKDSAPPVFKGYIREVEVFNITDAKQEDNGDTNITFSGSGEFDNVMTVSVSFEVDNGSAVDDITSTNQNASVGIKGSFDTLTIDGWLSTGNVQLANSAFAVDSGLEGLSLGQTEEENALQATGSISLSGVNMEDLDYDTLVSAKGMLESNDTTGVTPPFDAGKMFQHSIRNISVGYNRTTGESVAAGIYNVMESGGGMSMSISLGGASGVVDNGRTFTDINGITISVPTDMSVISKTQGGMTITSTLDFKEEDGDDVWQLGVAYTMGGMAVSMTVSAYSGKESSTTTEFVSTVGHRAF